MEGLRTLRKLETTFKNIEEELWVDIIKDEVTYAKEQQSSRPVETDRGGLDSCSGRTNQYSIQTGWPNEWLLSL